MNFREVPYPTVQPPSEIMGLVAEFHRAFDSPMGDRDNLERPYLRIKLISEETRELIDAMLDGRRSWVIKEMADLAYVLYGAALTFGIDLDEAVRRIHQSNMTKLDDNGDPIYREDGKVLKSSLYQEPDLSDL